MVVPHLRVAVRFPPTREGSGTKSTGRRPKNRASFRYPLRYVRRWFALFLAVINVSPLGAVLVLEPQVVEERSFSSLASVMQRQLPFIQTVQKTVKVPQILRLPPRNG